MTRDRSADRELLIVGGGLAGGLIALALANRGRGGDVSLIEQSDRLGGNHTWSFHDTDLAPDEHELVEPLISARWPRHVVRFPDHDRGFETGYCSVASDRFAEVLAPRLRLAGVHVTLGRRVSAVGSSMVRLDDETVLRGAIVIDARGPDPVSVGDRPRDAAYQKFVGLELELQSDGPWMDPILMDARVPQVDGFRFIYVLPFSRRRVLVEDTVYSGNASIDPVDGARRVLAYARRHGASVTRVLRQEIGVLPLPLRPPRSPLRLPQSIAPIAAGYRGGFFHPVTGYSLPIAARVALAIARASTPGETLAAVRTIRNQLRPQHRFGRLLNRMMFEAMPPQTRWNALDRFYRLPAATIARFYASRSTLWDRAQVLVGRPPAGISWRHLLGARWEESRGETS